MSEGVTLRYVKERRVELTFPHSKGSIKTGRQAQARRTDSDQFFIADRRIYRESHEWVDPRCQSRSEKRLKELSLQIRGR